MDAIRAGLYAALTPVLVFATFFLGFYALLFAAGRADWLFVAAGGLAAIAAAVAAFVVRKTRPILAIALGTLPALLLLAVLVLR
jgi:hypothetical protein